MKISQSKQGRTGHGVSRKVRNCLSTRIDNRRARCLLLMNAPKFELLSRKKIFCTKNTRIAR
jgi:hypothetical protein